MTYIPTTAVHRHTLRLPPPGTPAGAAPPAVYFVTLATVGRECLFGSIAPGGALDLNEFGWIVRREWLRTGFVRPELQLDAYVVMPNHLHAVVAVDAARAAAGPVAQARVAECRVGNALPPHRVLGAVIAGFKAMCTVQINHRRGRPGAAVWQRNFVERVVRSGPELDAARRHIEQNPERWGLRSATP